MWRLIAVLSALCVLAAGCSGGSPSAGVEVISEGAGPSSMDVADAIGEEEGTPSTDSEGAVLVQVAEPEALDEDEGSASEEEAVEAQAEEALNEDAEAARPGVPDISVPPVVAGYVGSGSDGFVSVPAEPGVPPADGPLEVDEGGTVDGVSGEEVGIAPPVVVADASDADVVEVEVEYGVAPEGYEGWAPCAFGLPCGKSEALRAPPGLECSASARTIVLSWGPVREADGYKAKIQMAEPYSPETQLSTTSTSATFTDLVPSTRYWVSAMALRGNWEQLYSGVNCITAVGEPRCEAVSTSWVRLEWSADSRVSHWYLARATTGGQFTDGQFTDGRIISGEVTSTEFSGLSLGQPYTFYFWWWDGNSWNGVWPHVSCTTEAPPAAPSVSCTSTASSLTVNWEPVAGAVEYRVTRGNGWVRTTSQSHVFNNLPSSTEYGVQVEALGSGNSWGAAGTAECTTLEAILPAPTGLTCSATSSTEIRFSWNPMAGADSYTARVQLPVAGSEQTETATGSTQVTFTDLEPSTKYWVSVVAVKDSAPQRFSGVNCTTLAALPSPEVTCIASPTTPTTAIVTWMPLAEVEVSRYRSQIQGVDSTQQETAIGERHNAAELLRLGLSSDSSRAFTGLATDTLYVFGVQVGSASGEWGPAGTVNCRTRSQALACGTATNETIEIRWEPNSEYSQWHTTGFNLATKDYLPATTHSFDELSRTFTGLQRETTYILRLWGLDSDNNWQEIGPSPQCTTRALAPLEILETTSSGNTFTIHWKEVENAAIYLIAIQKTPGLGAEEPTDSQITTEAVYPGFTYHTFTDLLPGTSYDYTVITLTFDQETGFVHDWETFTFIAGAGGP